MHRSHYAPTKLMLESGYHFNEFFFPSPGLGTALILVWTYRSRESGYLLHQRVHKEGILRQMASSAN